MSHGGSSTLLISVAIFLLFVQASLPQRAQSQVAASTTALVTSINPSYTNQAIDFTATVSGQPGVVPTGTVTFGINWNNPVTVSLTNGQAVFPWTFLHAGARTVTASYSGDSNNQASVSTVLNQTVNQQPTQTSLVSSINPSVANQVVAFTALVAGQYGGTPTGTVTFTINGNNPVTVPLTTGQAQFESTFVQTGAQTVTASYSGDQDNSPSTSTTLNEQVNPLPATQTSLTSSVNPSLVNQLVVYTATVTGQPGIVPTGTVTFTINYNAPVTVPLTSGQAMFPWTFLHPGLRTVTSSYSGDSNNQPSVSTTLNQTVNQQTQTTLFASINPSIINQAVTFAANVTGQYGGISTGTVTFNIDWNAPVTVLLTNGEALFTWTFLYPGARTVTASYSGDVGDSPSTSPTLSHMVLKPYEDCQSNGIFDQLCITPIDMSSLSGTLPPNTFILTYDDGPTPYSTQLGSYLQQNGIHATFFITGCQLLNSPYSTNTDPDKPTPICQEKLNSMNYQDPNILNDLVSLGHRIGLHTEDHLDLTVPPVNVPFEVNTLWSVLAPYIPDGLMAFRSPYLTWNNVLPGLITNNNPMIGPISADIGTATSSTPGYPTNNADWYCAQSSVPVSTCGNNYIQAMENASTGIVLIHDWNEYARCGSNGALGSCTGAFCGCGLGVPSGQNFALTLTQQLLSQMPRPTYTFVPLDAIPGMLGPHQFASPALWTSAFSDADGWGTNSAYYESIRLADVNGDHLADVCGRGVGGIYCALSQGGNQFAPAAYWLTSDFTDSQGWDNPMYGSTIQFGDVNGDGFMDVCGRGPAGILCALGNGSSFAAPTLWSSGTNFSDADGWGNSAAYYGSIRLIDVDGDGKADVCGRTTGGIVCALSSGSNFLPSTYWLTSQFTDSQGWNGLPYGTTIQFGDVNGDGIPDVCGRESDGVVCALGNGTSFGPTMWSTGMFPDTDGWAETPAYYKTVSLADINGDGIADLCGRLATGIVCTTSNGSQFANYHYYQNMTFTDVTGWNPEMYGATVQFGDINGDGKADACGRTNTGIVCGIAQ